MESGSFSVKVILNPELRSATSPSRPLWQTDGRVSSRMEEVEQALPGRMSMFEAEKFD